ncbi:MAG: bifunctional 4-hydroxy-2-oxoglutarate aldolase/2-dehydro-3-deoxy-phosphogluconate aldolase [Candidatus Aminicenantes bacterium]|nr:bifunctional 4-hydroxy-2-oxoglutarate aldolase/2-dehydro-3-deoxy-phosphogluconate aldolase [Candidatus Aminicenantes bacterium]
MRAQEVLDIVLATKVIAVIRMSDVRRLSSVVEAIERGGVRAIEITMTTPSALEIIGELAVAKRAGTLIGAGTVLDAQTAERVILAGAEFVVSPVTNAEMISACKRNDIFVAPGAFTPTEILAAWEKGADVVKVFPATSVGPKYFRDLRGPLPQVLLMPTGGVNIENAGEFIRSGACCVAIGTALLDKELIAAADWDGLTEKTKALLESLS